MLRRRRAMASGRSARGALGCALFCVLALAPPIVAAQEAASAPQGPPPIERTDRLSDAIGAALGGRPAAGAAGAEAQATAREAAGATDGAPVVDPTLVLARANASYDARDFAAAIAGYRALVESGHRHPLLHYNLGNAYLRAGELGRAIASYRRAATGAPRNPEVRANLAFARRNARDAVAPPEPSPVMRTVFAWHYQLARTEVLWIAAALNLALWTLLALRLWRRREWQGWTAAVAAVLMVACVGSFLVRRFEPLRVAVVVPLQVEVRTGTGDDALVRFRLHAGSEVRVREEREGWLRVALPDGEQGWMPAEAAEVVEL